MNMSLFGTEPPEWEQELMEGAWQILHDEPGTDREEWRQELLAQYPTEVVDTFGPIHRRPLLPWMTGGTTKSMKIRAPASMKSTKIGPSSLPTKRRWKSMSSSQK